MLESICSSPPAVYLVLARYVNCQGGTPTCALALQQSGRPLTTGEYKHAKWNEGIRIALDENATIACRAGERPKWLSLSLKKQSLGPCVLPKNSRPSLPRE